MSDLEDTLAWQIKVAGLPLPLREYRFAAPRRWSMDFAWPDHQLAVEVEGGTWVHGRHNRGAGFALDAEKHNTAVLNGWSVLTFPGQSVENGSALEALERILSASTAGGNHHQGYANEGPGTC